MGRADVRSRRHRGDVRGYGDDDAGRGRPRPGRGDVDDDGDGGVQDPLGDVPHGQIEAARRIETDDQPLRAALGRLIDALDDVFGNGRRDGGADRDHIEDRRLLRSRDGSAGHEKTRSAVQSSPRPPASFFPIRVFSFHRSLLVPRSPVFIGHLPSQRTFMIIWTSSQTCFFAPGFLSR